VELEIKISADEVEEIIANHIKNHVLFNYSMGKIIRVRGGSYSGNLSAVVTIEDAPIDAAKET
jgi:alpha-D-ribose 1-methylphosphonate 5-triphosphate diphosphatase PhnM